MSYEPIGKFDVTKYLRETGSAERTAKITMAERVYKELRKALAENGYPVEVARIVYDKEVGKGPNAWGEEVVFSNFDKVYDLATKNSHRFRGLRAEIYSGSGPVAIMKLHPSRGLRIEVNPENDISEIIKNAWDEVISEITNVSEK